jgi:predicted transcriptional regulator
MSTTISFRTEEAKRDELDRLAEALDRDRSWVINDAIEHYLDLQRWQMHEIEKGIVDTDAGRTLSTEQVRDLLASRNTAAR